MRHDYYPCHLLARHCGAVLLGKKPAGLFSISKSDGMVKAIDCLAHDGGLNTIIMQSRGDRALLFVYSLELLDQALSDKTARNMLEKLGYPQKGGAEPMLGHLKGRIAAGEGFPHEIGFFLGYPPADVVGFIIYGGKNSKHSCMWKVYGNVDTAKDLCALYKECQRLCFIHLESFGRLPLFISGFNAN